MRGRVPATSGLRDAAFACCLTLVLSIGVVGVLLLNTSMQQQSDRLDLQRRQVADLSTAVQQLTTALDAQSDPAKLAAKARKLHMRPVTRPQFVTNRGVIAPSREGAQDRAG